MKNNTFKTIIKLGFVNFWRNRWLSIAATLIMVLTLLTISIFGIFNIVINTTINNIKEKIDIAVYINDSALDSQVKEIQNQLLARGDVKSVNYISKEEAFRRWQDLRTSDKIKGLITAEENPLPRSLEIKANDTDQLDAITQFVSSDRFKPIVRSVSYQRNKDIVQKLINITNFTRKIGWALSAFFVIISVLVILNTIRLTIFTRKDEIEIMKLVGASDVFIRVPFIIEGALYGIFASIITFILIGIGVHAVSPMITRYLGDVNLDLISFYWQYLGLIFLFELFLGVFISIICSLFAIRRHLKI